MQELAAKKEIDLCEARNLLYEIIDVEEVAIRYLDEINGCDSNPVITILRHNRQALNKLTDMLDE